METAIITAPKERTIHVLGFAVRLLVRDNEPPLVLAEDLGAALGLARPRHARESVERLVRSGRILPDDVSPNRSAKPSGALGGRPSVKT